MLIHLHIYGCSGTSTAQTSIQHRSYGSQSQRYLLSGPKWEEFEESHSKILALGFPGGAVVENLPANVGDMGSSPGLGGSHMPRSS